MALAGAWAGLLFATHGVVYNFESLGALANDVTACSANAALI